MNHKVNDIEAAKIIGLAVQTMRNWRHLRKGPKYLKIGRSIRYDLLDIFEWCKKNTINPEEIYDGK